MIYSLVPSNISTSTVCAAVAVFCVPGLSLNVGLAVRKMLVMVEAEEREILKTGMWMCFYASSNLSDLNKLAGIQVCAVATVQIVADHLRKTHT